MQHFEKLLTGLMDPRDLFQVICKNTQYQVAFEDLKGSWAPGNCSRKESLLWERIWSWLSWRTLSVLTNQAKQDLRGIRLYSCGYIASKLQMASWFAIKCSWDLNCFREASPLVSSRDYGEMTNDGKLSLYLNRKNYLAFIIWRSIQCVARIPSVQASWVKIFYK